MIMKFLLRKTNSMASAAIYAILGLFLLFWPGLSTDILCLVIGAVLLACGIMHAVIFFARRDGTVYTASHMFIGIILIAVGLWIMFSPSLIVSIIPRVIGALICMHGLSNIRDSLALRRSAYVNWSAALVLGSLSLILGIILICNPFQAFSTIIRALGFFLLYDGLSDFWVASRMSAMRKEIKSADEAKETALDVNFKELP